MTLLKGHPPPSLARARQSLMPLASLYFQNPGIDIGDVSERRALRKSLKCKNFQWYLDHVYPEMRRYNNTIAYGEVIKTTRALSLDGCAVGMGIDLMEK